MNLAEYASYDALGLAELVARKQVSAKELALTAAAAVDKIDGKLKSVVELYPDRIEQLDEKSLGSGPFRGVPFLIKDVFGHEAGRKIEFGSRLCEGMTVETGTYFADMLKAAGVNILGRSAAPEYSMSATTESRMFGNTSNPWKHGYSAGGSSGGAQAAVLPASCRSRTVPTSAARSGFRPACAAGLASSPRACASRSVRSWTRVAGDIPSIWCRPNRCAMSRPCSTASRPPKSATRSSSHDPMSPTPF